MPDNNDVPAAIRLALAHAGRVAGAGVTLVLDAHADAIQEMVMQDLQKIASPVPLEKPLPLDDASIIELLSQYGMEAMPKHFPNIRALLESVTLTEAGIAGWIAVGAAKEREEAAVRCAISNKNEVLRKALRDIDATIIAIMTMPGDDLGRRRMAERLEKAAASLSVVATSSAQPIDMILYCPKCGLQHIDAPEYDPPGVMSMMGPWCNPPHRSHLCASCKHIWRPADVWTNGVAFIKTKGKEDSAAPSPPKEQQ